MKMNFVLGLVILAIAAAGCVGTVDGNKAGGLPLIRDKIEARYDRPAEEVFAAAKEVVAANLVSTVWRGREANAPYAVL